jgi:5-methylcytosine-specific restriction endonuclease McrA
MQRPASKVVNNARSAAWNEAHRLEIRQYFVDRMANDPEWAEKRRAHYRKMVARDRAAEVAKVRRWQKENPEQVRVQRNTRRARKLAIPSDLTVPEWMAILDHFGWRCVYCGIGGPMTMDHATPLSRGGHHAAVNIVPACRSCNSAKGALTAEEFRARRFAS